MFLYFLAVFFPLTELIKQILLYTHYDVSYCLWYFPFQLCSMPLYLLPIYAKTKSRVLESFLIDFCLLGGIFVFFDTSGLHYELPILTVHSYLWHIMMIIMGIYLMLRSKEKKTFKNYLPVAGLFLVLVTIATVLNLTLNTYGVINMFFVSPLYPMYQVVFCDIAETIGHPAAKALYLFCILIGGCIFHLLSGLVYAVRQKRIRKSDPTGDPL